MGNFWIIVGSISCATCVIIGAFGAHGLKDILNDYGKDIYEKGNLYHFFHSIGLIINGLLAKFFIDLNFNPSIISTKVGGLPFVLLNVLI